MSIAHYLRDIGRGKVGARNLNREQACDLMGRILDNCVSDLEIGAFCIAMRVKGESRDELLGFLDAVHQRIERPVCDQRNCIVIPSYNGARKLPLLTPLLALLLNQKGFAVLVHGCDTEHSRVRSETILAELGVLPQTKLGNIEPGQTQFVPTQLFLPSLERLLKVRLQIGVRNSAHSMVKLIQPFLEQTVLVSSYTHAEYASSMEEVLIANNTRTLLLRGTEGESVADVRRIPAMRGIHKGKCIELERKQESGLGPLPPDLRDTSVNATAQYIKKVLSGECPIPPAIERQITHIAHLTSLT